MFASGSADKLAEAQKIMIVSLYLPAKQLQGLGFGPEIDNHECVLRFNAGHDDDVALRADYGVKQTHKAFNPEVGVGRTC